jgi:hypothetical protein
MLAFDPLSRRLAAATYGRSFFSYQIDQPSAIEPILAERIVRPIGISPNPASAETGATIRWPPRYSGTVHVEMITVSGRRVWEAEVPGSAGQVRVEARNGRLPPGIYYVRASTGTRSIGRGTLALTR